MMGREWMPLVECVPNFSEGQRKDVIEAIVAAIASAPVNLLDVSSDHDHNRTVVTFAGEPQAVLEGAFRGAQVATSLIDLTVHTGVHPRIGAVDVIPFVPLRDISLAACADLARALGQRVGEELLIPVYLYEAAATRPERINLADVRRGGYEGLRAIIETDPSRTPDFGPARIGIAGAVAIGARVPLIAFNVYLDTADAHIAQAVAVTIRASGGGLPYVKALGLLVDGQAQVSINVIDYRQTSLFSIMEAVRAAAAQHGVRPVRSEVVGLVPRAALLDYAITSLMLPPEARGLLLEDRLGAAMGDYREIEFNG
jgi:glutamate formiminotransferase